MSFQAQIAEAQAERAERKYRRPLSESARESRAISHRLYGALSQSAEREAAAIERLSRAKRSAVGLIGMALSWKGERLTIGPTKAGYSAPDAPYVKIQRYPRRRTTRWWVKLLDEAKASGRWPVGAVDREIVTAADRKRRAEKRRRKQTIRAIAQMSDAQLAALERELRARKAG